MHLPTISPILLLIPSLLVAPTSASPLSHKHRKSRSVTNHISFHNYPTVGVSGDKRRDLESLGDESEDTTDPDFPEFPEFPDFPDLSLPDFPDLEVPADPSVPVPSLGPASANKVAGDCGEAQALITITQVQITTETTTQTTIETTTTTITESSDNDDNFFDNLFNNFNEVKKEFITMTITTTETEFAPGQTVTVTAEEVHEGSNGVAVVTVTVTENLPPVTVTETEVQIQTVTATVEVVEQGLNTGGGNEDVNPGEESDHDAPPIPEPPAPPAPPAPPEVPAPTEEEHDHDHDADEQPEDINYRDFVDLGVMELDDEPMATAAPSSWGLDPTYRYNGSVAPHTSTSHSEILVLLPTPTRDTIGSSTPVPSSGVSSNVTSSVLPESPTLPTGEITTKTMTSTSTVTSTRTFIRAHPSAFTIPMIEDDSDDAFAAIDRP